VHYCKHLQTNRNVLTPEPLIQSTPKARPNDDSTKRATADSARVSGAVQTGSTASGLGRTCAPPAEANARQPCWPALLPFSLPSPGSATHLLPFRYGRRSGLHQHRAGHACRQRSAMDRIVR